MSRPVLCVRRADALWALGARVVLVLVLFAASLSSQGPCAKWARLG